MDLFQLIRKDHRRIKSMLAAVSGDYHTRRRQFAAAHQEVEAHTLAEEKVLYPLLATWFATVEQAEESRKEHEEIHASAERLLQSDLTEEAWMKLFFEWQNRIIHHMDEEEQSVLPEVRRMLSEAEARRLAARMNEEKSPQKDMMVALGLAPHLPQLPPKANPHANTSSSKMGRMYDDLRIPT